MNQIESTFRQSSARNHSDTGILNRRPQFLKLLLGVLLLLALPVSMLAAGFISVTSLQQVPVSASTGEKPQSKCWTTGGYWFAVFSTSSGTNLYRLDGTAWTNILHLSDATDAHADAKAAGGVTHILLFRGASSQLVSVEYIPGTHSYQMWSTRPALVNLTLDSGVETGTIDIDSYGRMWLASDAVSDINIRWSDSPYSSWSSPITIATGISSDDISVVTAIPALGETGILWANQNTQRFGFKTHVDGADPATWSADEIPASQSALNVGAGMADDHMNLAVASDGTIYAAVKTSYDTPGYPKIALLIRRPVGTWDNIYEVDQTGTRGVVLLNEPKNEVTVCYTQSEGSNDIVYKSSAISPIAFGTRQTLMSGSLNEPSSTKQNFTGDVVILGSTVPIANAVSILAKTADSGPVASYPMNEGSGTILADNSSNGNNGVINGAPVWTSGMKQQAISFNGMSQYAAVPHSTSLNITGNLTLTAWIAPGKTGTQRIIAKAFMGSTDGYELSLSSLGKVFTRFNQKSRGDTLRVNSVTSYPSTGTTWMHAAATYAGDSIRLYINGVEEGAVAMTVPIGTNTDSLYIGRQKDPSNPYWFQGIMDEARVYNRALSQAEIQSLANHTVMATAGTGGVISPTGSVSVYHAASQTFTITPDAGYSVASVTVDGVPQGAITTYTFSNVIADHIITAAFVANSTHTITATAGVNGTISPSGAVSVADGGSQTFTVTASAGYHIDSVIVNGAYRGALASYAFTNVRADSVIRATFAVTTHTLTTAVSGSGSVGKAPDQTAYNEGAVVQLTANPAGGWTFSGWSGDASGSSNPLSVTMNANKNITANFSNGDNLVGSWTMDEGSGSVLVDSSSYANTGSLYGSPAWVTGVTGKALALNGTTQYALVPDAPVLKLTSAITIAGWIKPGQYGTQDLVKKSVLGSTNGYEMSLATASSTWPKRVFVRFNQATSGDTYRLSARATSLYPIDGTWVHYAATYDGATIKLYINGSLDTSMAAVFTIATNTLPLSLGAQSDGTRNFMGQMDDIRVYNRALTAGEIQSLTGLIVQTDTIVASAGPNGSITPSGTVIVGFNMDTTFTISPNSGYQVDSVMVDGVFAGAVTSYHFSHVTSGHTISAKFRAATGQPLVGYWGMDEGSGTMLADSSSYHNNGTIAGTASWVSGQRGRALVFDGTTTYATVADTPSLRITGAITIATWIKPSQYGTQDLIKKAANGSIDGFELSLAAASGNPPRRPFVRFNQVSNADTYRLSSRVSSEYPIDGTWMHLAATYDGATIKMYINGLLDTSKAASFTIASNNLPLSLGGESSGARKFTGQLDEARIYNYALSAAEVHALVSGTHIITATVAGNGTITPSGLVAVNDGSNQSFTIAANTGNHIDSVVTDGTNRGAITTYTFTGVASDHTITAYFSPDGVVVHTITASAGTNGGISPSGAVSVTDGGSQAFTITPSTHYHIDSVLVNGAYRGALSSYTFTNVKGDSTIRATFAIDTYTLNVAIAGSGSVAKSPDQTVYGYGTSVQLSAIPGGGWTFGGWSGDASGSSNPISITMNANKNITATFTNPNTLVGLWAMNEGSGTTLVDASSFGNNGTITGSPAWVTGINGLALNFTGSQYAAVCDTPSLRISSAITLTAWIAPTQVNTQRLIAKAFMGQNDGYELSLSSTGKPYFRLNEHTSSHRLDALTPYPTSGMSWMHVAATYDGDSLRLYVNGIREAAGKMGTPINTNTDSLYIGRQKDPANPFYYKGKMDDARVYSRALSLSEIQALASHTITASAGTGGSITPGGSVSVLHYADQTLTIAPNPGYAISGVAVDGVSQGIITSYTFTRDSTDHTITATFVPLVITHTVTASAGANGSISPSGAVSVTDGGSQSFTITPADHYHVDSVIINGAFRGAMSGYTFTNVRGDSSIRAAFAMNQFTLTVAPPVNGIVTLDPAGGTYDTNSVVQLTAVANSGYHFTGWGGDAAGAVNPLSVTMNSNKNITAGFAINTYTLTVTTPVNGTVTKNPDQAQYDSATVVQLTAAPSAGYGFSAWSGTDVPAGHEADNPLSLTMNANKSVAASFQLNQMKITLRATNQVVAGLNATALDGVDPQDIGAPPPPPSNYMQLYYLLAPGQPISNFDVDIKKDEPGLAASAKRWALRAISDRVDSSATITVAGSTLPPGFRPILYNLQSGFVQNLNVTPVVTFTLPPVSGQVFAFTLLIGDSTKPAVTVLQPNGGEQAAVGTRDTIRWSSGDGSGILRHYVYYSLSGADPYTLIDSTNGNVTSLVWMPSAASPGARIKVIARDSVMNEQEDVSDQVFTVQGSMSVTANAGWNLVSLPLQQADMTPSGVFGDDYGTESFYMYQYNGVLGYSIPTVLTSGRGYWLGSASAQTIDVEGSSLNTASTLLTAGFNIIGNPFITAEPTTNLQFTYNAQTKDWANAVLAGWVANALWSYSGSGYSPAGTTLDVWKGYWIPMIVGGATVQYTPQGGSESPKQAAAPDETAGRTNWSVDLTARLVTRDGKIHTDDIAGFGLRTDAKDGFDNRYDVPRPPRCPADGYVEVGFPVSGADYPAVLGTGYARIFKGNPDQARWNFTVTTSAAGTITLHWSTASLVVAGSDMKVILYDEAAHKSIDMKTVDSYTYDQTGTSRTFMINSPERAVPETFRLAQNYPNPFNPQTTITYGLPADAVVTLEIYNLLGERVRTLVENEMKEAGYHDVKFDAASLSSGLYFYRLSAAGTNGERFADLKKMLLVK